MTHDSCQQTLVFAKRCVCGALGYRGYGTRPGNGAPDGSYETQTCADHIVAPTAAASVPWPKSLGITCQGIYQGSKTQFPKPDPAVEINPPK